MTYLDTLKAFFKPIEDVFEKTEEKTKVILRIGNGKLTLSTSNFFEASVSNVTIEEPVSNKPGFFPIPLPIPDPGGITTWVNVPVLVLPHSNPNSSSCNIKDQESPSQITIIPPSDLPPGIRMVPSTLTRVKFNEDLKNDDRLHLQAAGSQRSRWSKNATHIELESQCARVEVESDRSKLQMKPFIEEKGMEMSAENHLSLLSTESIINQQYQKVFSKFLNDGIVYFRMIEQKISKTLDLVKRTPRKDLGQLVIKLEELRRNYDELVDTLHSLQLEEFKSVTKEVEQHPDFLRLKWTAQKIIQNYDQLTFDKIKKYFPGEEIDVKEEHFLCSILGLNNSVAKYLIDMDQSMKSHQTYQYWILSYLEQHQPDGLGAGIQKDFETMGFTSERANYLAKQLSSHPFNDHLTLHHWATRYIEEAFKYDVLLNESCDSYSLPEKIGEVEVIWKKEDSVDDESTNSSNNEIKGIKIDASNDVNNTSIQPYLSNQALEMQGIRYWFHGTDHKSAWNIIKDGILLDRGKAAADFSDEKGFYLTPNFQFAKAWPQKMKKKTSAVIVFDIENPREVFQNYQGLEFFSGSQDWENIVAYYRNGALGSSKKRREKEAARKYIYGPISMDGSKVKDPNWKPRVRETIRKGETLERPPMQLCVKDDFLSEDIFDMSNIFVIFFV